MDASLAHEQVCKLSYQDSSKNRGINYCKSPISFGSGQQDVDYSGVATGRGAFHFRSSSSVADEENRHWVKVYFIPL
ncbi:hypothetical protein [Rummeliibacillus suwonensis]|uniref:hypothetical protein n=1 Tax=Rummeliibacillus suwonensis TaxID=1306154 RepID=UPI001AAE6E5B|nr:hypothetical protein [Rummeliibacillus suwonensis]MBO2535176.1 hypothetical protein [Rummeliibacillus suwonensis]